MEKGAKIYVAGHTGLVGSALTRKLREEGYHNLLLRTRAELDLCDQAATADVFRQEQPDYVILAAARVGGIVANESYPAEFLYDNLMIQANIIQSARQQGVRRLLFLGSSCIYPKLAPQPLKEEYLLTGPLEPTNDAYAVAKIAGVKMCQAYNRQYGTRFLAAMPANLYGPNDNFDLETSHVLPALLRKFHEAQAGGMETVAVWGTGTPLREFLHVDDLADGILFLLNLPDKDLDGLLEQPAAPALVNIGSGEEISIADLALLIGKVTGFTGRTLFDATKPDGTPRKVTDTSRLSSLGWRSGKSLAEGIRDTYRWYLEAMTPTV